mmetsp:Transcript_12457/g.31376  ORF Transcript_12457/g.31376 Transcript_12457/m.31376 type:complete len:293 (+) Transcript_12457:1933-2811(+)
MIVQIGRLDNMIDASCTHVIDRRVLFVPLFFTCIGRVLEFSFPPSVGRPVFSQRCKVKDRHDIPLLDIDRPICRGQPKGILVENPVQCPPGGRIRSGDGSSPAPFHHQSGEVPLPLGVLSLRTVLGWTVVGYVANGCVDLRPGSHVTRIPERFVRRGVSRKGGISIGRRRMPVLFLSLLVVGVSKDDPQHKGRNQTDCQPQDTHLGKAHGSAVDAAFIRIISTGGAHAFAVIAVAIVCNVHVLDIFHIVIGNFVIECIIDIGNDFVVIMVFETPIVGSHILPYFCHLGLLVY